MCSIPAFFQSISLETTVRGVPRFVRAAAQVPRDALINIAHIGADSWLDRLQAVEDLRFAGLTPRPIISARRVESVAELEAFLHAVVHERGVRRLFLVGGDPAAPVGPFEGALSLIDSGVLDGLPLDGICLPGHPEGHPVIPREQLMDHLLRKIRALEARGFRTDITTQICVDPAAVVDWIRAVRAQGIQATIRVGVPSPATVDDMLRFYRLCRADTSADALARHGWISASDAQRADPRHFIRTLLKALSAAEAERDTHTAPASPDLGDVHLHLFPMTALPDTLAGLADAFRAFPDDFMAEGRPFHEQAPHDDPALLAFSLGILDATQTLEQLGLNSEEELFLLMMRAGLPMPRLDEETTAGMVKALHRLADPHGRHR